MPLPGCASAAAVSSWVDSGLDAARSTRAPPARSALIRTALSAVTCRQAATVRPSSGCSAANLSATRPSTGMARRAQPIRVSPASARSGSAMSDRAGAGPEPGSGAAPASRPDAASDSRPGAGAEPRSGAAPDRGTGSVAVGVGLVRAVDPHPDVVGLVLGQLGEPDAERVQVQPGHLLVQVLGQRIHPDRVVLGLGEQLDLGHYLVGEAVGHHEAG